MRVGDGSGWGGGVALIFRGVVVNSPLTSAGSILTVDVQRLLSQIFCLSHAHGRTDRQSLSQSDRQKDREISNSFVSSRVSDCRNCVTRQAVFCFFPATDEVPLDKI